MLECPVLALGLQCCCQHWAGKLIHTQQAGGVSAKTAWGWPEKDFFFFFFFETQQQIKALKSWHVELKSFKVKPSPHGG